jgi:peptidoglycan/LPS O-acetylase OafA/YrhL
VSDTDDTRQLLSLLHQVRGNRRRMVVGLAISVLCLAAMILHAIRDPGADDWKSVLTFFTIAAVGSTAMWFVARLAKENVELRRQSSELGKKLERP